MQFWKTLNSKGQRSLFQRSLYLNYIEFERELHEGLYGGSDILQLLKYICQHKNDYLIFELKIIIIINRVINIYLVEKNL